MAAGSFDGSNGSYFQVMLEVMARNEHARKEMLKTDDPEINSTQPKKTGIEGNRFPPSASDIIIYSNKEVQQMKKEIMEILAMRREDLHGKKRHLYYMLYFSVIIVQVLVLLYLGERLSFGMFLLVSAAYISLLLVFVLEAKKIRSRMELSE